MDIQIVADGLGFPEGPVAMADGSMILVEIARGSITRVSPGGKTETIAEPGGGPNGAAIGPDGALYVCNNGGFEWHDIGGMLIPGHASADYSGGRVERVDLATGKVERLFDEVAGYKLKGPNDIVFDKAGGFYFTDLGKSYGDTRQRDMGALYYAKPGFSDVVEVAHSLVTPNGVGLSPDEDVVYMADTIPGRLWAFDLESPGVAKAGLGLLQQGYVVAGPGGLQYFDSLAVTASGKVCVATILNGGITQIAPNGSFEHFAFPDPLVTNICFGGDDMHDAWVTLSSSGQLAKCRWPEPGLKLNFNA